MWYNFLNHLEEIREDNDIQVERMEETLLVQYKPGNSPAQKGKHICCDHEKHCLWKTQIYTGVEKICMSQEIVKAQNNEINKLGSSMA